MSYSFSNMAWNFIDEYLYNNNGGSLSYYIVLTLVCCIGNLLGAFLADMLSKRLRSLRVVAALGTLLSAPLIFMYWQLMKQSALHALTNTNLVMICLTGVLESIGEGMLLTAAFAYMCK